MNTISNTPNAVANSFFIRRLSLPLIRAAHGIILAMLVPAGWVLTQWIAGRSPLAAENIDFLLYAYVSIVTASLSGCVGYLIGKREQTITDLALSDGLTDLYNKRYFQTRLEQEFERFQRYSTPLSLVQIDLDHFKQINDTWGHQTGDMVLKAVGKTILENLRTGEIAARVGGEEICIIVSNSSAQAAFQLAERLRKTLKSLELTYQGEHIDVSASFGVAQADANTLTKWQLYEHADKALYQAKRNGRDLCYIYSNELEQAA